MSTTTIAPAHTLLGKLQRGLGAGFLEARGIDAATAHELLLACLAQDPRHDPAEEHRGRYYGELALETRIDLAELAALVDGADDWPASRRLVLETVGWLAWRGIAGPTAMLRRYVADGGQDAARAASFLWHPQAFAGLDEAIVGRYESADALAEALRDAGVALGRDPWETWRRDRPVIAEALEKAVRAPLESVPDPPHSTLDDDPLALVEALAAALEREECVCDLSRALARTAGDPLALLERAFRQTPRSSCRVTIARELTQSSDAFGRLRALECLWDAEPGVVAAAAATVDVDAPGARERLETLARDGLAPAQARLAV